ncbi:MAG TPA: AsmA-like C-terminal region-containing protein [Chthoniobacterales bacterium]|nr:AsmA-like C-terminal region-containing protein [Chthoniobacterales bacterium]
MGRLRRVALWFGAAVIGIAAALLIVMNLYVQSQGAQARIEQELSRRLGTPIQIRSVSVTPWSGLTLSGITIPQASGTLNGNFLEARSFHLHVRILPLFSRRLIIKQVSLLEPNVVWGQDAGGKWRLPGAEPNEVATAMPAPQPEPAGSPAPGPDLTSASPAPAAELPAQVTKTGPPTSSSMFVPELRRLNVSDGSFRFLDQAGAPVALFDGVRFRSSVRNGDTLRGSVGVARISLRDRFFLQNLKSPLHYRPAELNLPEISAQCGSGQIKGQFSLQTQAANSPFSVGVIFREVQADQIVAEAGGPKGVVRGRLEGNFNADGKSSDAAALTGKGEIYLREGQLQQYSLLVALGQILQIEELTQLQLQQAEAKYHIDPGLVTIDRLVLRSPNIRVTSTGTISFKGRMRLQSQLAINDKIRDRLFNPIRNNFQPIDEPGYSAVEFDVGGTVERPKTNLVDRVVGRNLKDFVSGLLGGKPDKPKRKRARDSAPSDSPGSPPPAGAIPEVSPEPANSPP